MTPRQAAERILEPWKLPSDWPKSEVTTRREGTLQEHIERATAIIQAAIDEAHRLEPTDPRVVRIAKALAEGCDGRSFASEDAKTLARKYDEWSDRMPDAGFVGWANAAFCEFIVEVLNAGPIPKPRSEE